VIASRAIAIASVRDVCEHGRDSPIGTTCHAQRTAA
jgi:hypothetical protein